MERKEQELNSQIGGTLQDKTKHMILHEPIENTPFVLITVLDRGTFVAIGRHRLTEYFPSKEHALQLIEGKDWNLIVGTVIALVQTLNTDLEIITEVERLTEEN